MRALPAAARLLPRVAREKRAPIATTTYWGRPVPGFGDPRRAAADPRSGAGGARRQPHRPRLHRRRHRRLGRLPDGGAAPRRASPTSRRRSTPTTACRLRGVLHRRGRALRAARQQAAARRDRGLPRASGGRSRGAAAPARGRGARQGGVGRVARAWSATYTLCPGRGRHSGTAPWRPGAARHARAPPGSTLVGCFHPSRQNTHTGKVTAAMYDDVFGRAGSQRPARGSGLGARGSARQGFPRRCRVHDKGRPAIACAPSKSLVLGAPVRGALSSPSHQTQSRSPP